MDVEPAQAELVVRVQDEGRPAPDAVVELVRVDRPGSLTATTSAEGLVTFLVEQAEWAVFVTRGDRAEGALGHLGPGLQAWTVELTGGRAVVVDLSSAPVPVPPPPPPVVERGSPDGFVITDPVTGTFHLDYR